MTAFIMSQCPRGFSSLASANTKGNVLPEKKQREYVALYQKTGDSEALNQLITTNIRLIIKLASPYAKSSQHLDDLITAGVTGAIEGFKRYDPDNKADARVMTYCTFWIRQSILAALRDEDQLVRLPANKVLQVRALLKKRERCGSTKFSCDDELLMAKFDTPRTLDTEVSTGKGVVKVKDTLVFLGETPDDDIANQMIHSTVLGALSCLTPKERRVVELRYNLNDHSLKYNVPLDDVGKVVSLTRESVRRIETIALGKLRKNLAKKGIRNYRAIA